MAERERNAECDIGLAAIGSAEPHREGAVEHDPRDEDALGELHPNVCLARSGGHVPVDQADVVTRHVGAYLGEFGATAEQVRAVIAREEAVDAATDRELECTEQRLRHRPGAGALRCLDDTECPQSSHAATGLPSSSAGAATRSSTASSTSSAVVCSARAR